MSFSKINYGVVGTGHIGNFHTQQIKNIKNHANLIGVYDINYEQAKKLLISGFFLDVIEKITDEEIKNFIKKTMELNQ